MERIFRPMAVGFLTNFRLKIASRRFVKLLRHHDGTSESFALSAKDSIDDIFDDVISYFRVAYFAIPNEYYHWDGMKYNIDDHPSHTTGSLCISDKGLLICIVNDVYYKVSYSGLAKCGPILTPALIYKILKQKMNSFEYSDNYIKAICKGIDDSIIMTDEEQKIFIGSHTYNRYVTL